MKNFVAKKEAKNYTIDRFRSISSFETIRIGNKSYYYVVDIFDYLIVLDENLNFLFSKNYSYLNYIKAVNSFLYVTAGNDLYKTDYNLNTLASVNRPGSYYMGVFYNYTDDTVFVADFSNDRIHIYTQNLNTLIDNWPIASFGYLSTINGYNDYLYVSVYNWSMNSVLVLKNKQLLTIITEVSFRTPFVTDPFGYLAIGSSRSVKLYYANGTYANISKRFPFNIESLNFEYNGRLMVASSTSIYIYYC